MCRGRGAPLRFRMLRCLGFRDVSLLLYVPPGYNTYCFTFFLSFFLGAPAFFLLVCLCYRDTSTLSLRGAYVLCVLYFFYLYTSTEFDKNKNLF